MKAKSEASQEQAKALEITCLNGRKYRFTECPFYRGETYIYSEFFWDGKWNRLCRDFKSLDEAKKFTEEINRQYSQPAPYFTSFDVPDDYYGVRGRYYGD